MQKKQMSNTHEKTRKEENYENGFDEIKTSIHLGVTAWHWWIAHEHKKANDLANGSKRTDNRFEIEKNINTTMTPSLGFRIVLLYEFMPP